MSAIFLQLGLSVTPEMVFLSALDFLGTPAGILILFAGGIFIFTIITLQIIRLVFKRRHRVNIAFRKAILLITVPKEALKAEEQKATSTAQEIQEDIAVAESLMAAVGGLKSEKGLKRWLFGAEETFAFEIVAHEGLISFYVAAPKNFQQFIEQQIHAQYPSAQIEEVEDYNIFAPQGALVGTYLVFKRENAFPIKTYRKMESDPLNALTNALSKVSPGDGVAIQYIARSARPGWRRYGIQLVETMQKGKTLKEARAAASFFGKIFGAFSAPPKPKPGAEPAKEHRLSEFEQEMLKGLEEKASKAGLDVNIRVIASAASATAAKMYVDNVVNAFNQYNIYQFGNSLARAGAPVSRLASDFIFRNFDERRAIVLNAEELAGLFHLPLPSTETPNIRWLMARKAPPPTNLPKEGLVLGKVVYRGEESIVRIKRADRRRHFYIIGKSGVGKSELMKNMAKQDIENGEGVCVVDPHGDFAEDMLGVIPKERADDVVYFDPSDMARPLGLNMLEVTREEQKDFAAQEMVSIFYKLFPPEYLGPMFEHNMRNVMLTLMSDMENPGTVAEIPRMFSDPDFQKEWSSKVKDPVVRAYWDKEIAKTSDFHKSEMLGYLISKVGRFVENDMMRNIIGQAKSGFDFRDVMDNKKILLVNLSKGKVGEVNANLLGLIIVSKLQMAALARADTPEEKRQDFYLYIDEFQNFITDSIATILSEARKYKLDLTMAHQYMGQLVRDGGDTKVRDAVLGNAGTMAAFRIGVEDAELLEKEFTPTFNAYDLVNVDKFTTNVKLLIDNTASKPFNMQAPTPIVINRAMAESIKQLSRLKYGRDRSIVEAEIIERTRLSEPPRTAGPTTGERLM